MAFRIPLSLISGGGRVTLTITTDTLIGNLWTYLGSPPSARDVEITVDGADIGDVQITLDWASGSTFSFTCINGGRILGLGGNGGAGGADLGATGDPGSNGSSGGAAIASSFNVSLDIDDGYLLGGGGGGGGGAYNDTGAGGDAGGGGGGGQGFSATTGGAAGSSIGSPPATAGSAGGQSGPGTAGNGGGTSTSTSAGGSGGIWGAGGITGRSTNLSSFAGTWTYYGGLGGRGGRAFQSSNGAVLSYSGSSSEATLRSQGRIKGETLANSINLPSFFLNNVSVAGASTTGFSFKTDGDLDKVESSGGNTTFSQYWASATSSGFGDDYEVRQRGLAGDADGTFDTNPGAAGTWFDLATARTWSIISSSGIDSAATLIELRRADLPAGSSDDETIDAFYIQAVDENGV